MTDRELLERIKRGEGLPPIPLKDDECNRHEDFDFIADYPKKDMSKVDRVRVNGKEYLAVDKVLEIVEGEASDPDHEKDNEGCMYSEGWIECGITIAEMIRALKGGEDEE